MHLRTKVVDDHRASPGRGVPTAEALAMKAGAWTVADAGRLEKAQSASTLAGRAAGRVLGGRATLGRLPWPLSAWSDARDAPVPPKQTFRQWWARTHDDDPDRHGRAGDA